MKRKTFIYSALNTRHNKHFKTGLAALAMVSAVAFAPASHAVLTYSQDFEGTDPAVTNPIGDNFVIGNFDHTTSGGWFAGLAAPNSPVNGTNGYSALVGGQGGAAQGDVVLSVFGDYNPFGPWNNSINHDVEFFVFRDIGNLAASDAGETYRFSFDAKNGGLDAASAGGASSKAYISILDPGNNFGLVTTIETDTTGLTANWSGGFVDVLVPGDNSWDGYLLQIGFAARGTELEVGGVQEWPATGQYYDNINLDIAAVPVPAAVWLFGSGLLGLVGVARRKQRC